MLCYNFSNIMLDKSKRSAEVNYQLQLIPLIAAPFSTHSFCVNTFL